jgi:hypothetical protein
MTTDDRALEVATRIAIADALQAQFRVHDQLRGEHTAEAAAELDALEQAINAFRGGVVT